MAAEFNPAFATAEETAGEIRGGKISASELLDLTFQRIDLHNASVNAVIWQFRERAAARAHEADEAWAKGASWGPLHGVPVTIKESFAYPDSPNSWGLPPLKDGHSSRTAVAVERLESAGAIVAGKTNVPLGLGDFQTYNPIYGVTNNPWDLARTPGGSTGGGAAALASGIGCLSLGSDLAGSIRVPAHFCGVYGHKPTLQLVSIAGHQPGPWDGSPGLPMDLAVAGPLARGARDLTLALNAMGGPNGDEATAWSWRLPPPRHQRLKDFRIGYVMDSEFAPLASDVQKVYEDTVGQLRKAGAQLEAGWPMGIEPREQLETFYYLLSAFLSLNSTSEQREAARARLEKDPNDIFAAGAVEPHSRWLRESQRRLNFRVKWAEYFERHDVFLTPASFCAAFPHDHSQPVDRRVVETAEGQRPYGNIGFWAAFASLTGLPATVAPIGRTAAGLPVGLQIFAPMWNDATSIEFAHSLTEIGGGFVAPRDFQA
ncbi:MAG TPA: amidase [Bryobacteraceae bacterium]